MEISGSELACSLDKDAEEYVEAIMAPEGSVKVGTPKGGGA